MNEGISGEKIPQSDTGYEDEGEEEGEKEVMEKLFEQVEQQAERNTEVLRELKNDLKEKEVDNKKLREDLKQALDTLGIYEEAFEKIEELNNSNLSLFRKFHT